MKIDIQIKGIDLTKNEEILELLNSFNSKHMVLLTKSQRSELLTMIANLRMSEVFEICGDVNINKAK